MNPHKNTQPQKSLRLAVLVSGRGSNLQAILDAQADGRLKSQVILVISNKPEAQALQRAHQSSISTRVVPSKGKSRDEFAAELLQVLHECRPDLIVLAGFMKILHASVIHAFPGRIINIHPSLLPQFPGLNAQQQAIDAKAQITGCTVHFVDEGCDTGPVILQEEIPLHSDDTVDSLSERLLTKEHDCLIRALASIENGEVVLQGEKTLLRK